MMDFPARSDALLQTPRLEKDRSTVILELSVMSQLAALRVEFAQYLGSLIIS